MIRPTIDAPDVPPAGPEPTAPGAHDEAIAPASDAQSTRRGSDAQSTMRGSDAGMHPIGWPMAIAVGVGTILVIVALAVLALMTPLYMHGALERAGSPGFLGVTAAEAYGFSDATVRELIVGPGTFEIGFSCGRCGTGFYDAAEASHLRDARAVLYGLLALAGLSLVVLAVGLVRSRRRARYWRSVSVGAGILAAAFVVIGALFLVAFDAAFTLFHEIFFPGGNWSFDFATERLVQLYPIPFWEEATTVLGVTVIGLGAVTWWLARRRARRLEAGAPA
jgi:hypothetical protein